MKKGRRLKAKPALWNLCQPPHASVIEKRKLALIVFALVFISDGKLSRMSFSSPSYQMSQNYRKDVYRIFNHHRRTKDTCFTDDN